MRAPRDVPADEEKPLIASAVTIPAAPEGSKLGREDVEAASAETLPGMLGPYELLRELGRGGMGVVLMARDTRDQRLVALKLLSSTRGDRNRLMRFRREFQAVRHLDHPHVVRVHDADFQERHPYFVMELVQGVNLRQHVPKAWGGAGSQGLARHVDELLGIARQIVEALGYIHSRRLVHRDLKPDNIMVETDGTAKLMDFGLAMELDDPMAYTQTGRVMGTVAYMAPEQILGHKELDGRTDYYALGVSLYEIVTGRRPFQGDNPAAILQKHLQEKPRPPRELAPWLDPELESLILGLMSRERQNRPATAEEILRRLDGLLARGRAETTPGSSAVSDVLIPALVGHDGLGQWLGKTLQEMAAEAPRARVVLVSGRAGFGKSRWLDAIADWARHELLPVCRASCHQERRSPFSAFGPLLESAGEQLGWLSEEEKSELAPVAALVPALGPVLGADEQVSARHALPAALRLLKLALGDQPQILLLDDLHWADELSLEFLEILAQPASGLPLLVVATYRPEALEEGHRLEEILGRTPDVLRRDLQPLPRQELARLVASALGATAEDVSEALASAVAEAAQGSPLLALQTLGRLVNRGQVLWVEGRLALDRAGQQAGTWVEGRLALDRAGQQAGPGQQETGRLVPSLTGPAPGLERQILDLAAVFGKGVPMEVLAALVDAEEPWLLDALNRLLQRRVLRASKRSGQEAFEFAQQAVRDEVYTKLGDRQRRELHGRVARSLQGRSGPSEPPLEALAYHYCAAGETEPALEYLRKSVKKAARLYAHRDAIRLADEALELLEPRGLGRLDGEPCRLASDASGRERHERNSNQDAHGRNEGQGKLAPDAAAWAQKWDFLVEQFRAWLQLGNLDEALRIALLALEAARASGNVQALLRAENNLGVLYNRLRRFDLARSHFETALQMARDHGLPELEAHVLNSLGLLPAVQGQRSDAREHLEAGLRLAQGLGDRASEVTALLNLAKLNLDAARTDEAQAQIRQVEEVAARLGMEVDVVRGRVLGARGLRMQGRWRQAEAAWREALELAMKVSDTTWIQWTLLQLADLELDRGRLAQADDWLAGLADTEPKVLPSERAPSKLELRRVQDPTNRMRYQRVLAKMQLARGEWAGAIRGLEQVLEGGLSAGPGDGVVLRVVYGRALGMAGRMREALSLLDQVEQECLKIQMDSFLTVLRFTKLLLRLEISRAPQTLLDPMQSLKTEALERGETLWVHRIELRQLALQGDAHAASWQTAFGVFRQEQAFADLAAGALLQAETLLETKQETEAAALLEQHATDLIGLGMPWLELVHSSLFAAADRSAAGADFGARGMEQLRSLTAALDEQERDAFLRRPAVQAIRRRLGQRR